MRIGKVYGMKPKFFIQLTLHILHKRFLKVGGKYTMKSMSISLVFHIKFIALFSNIVVSNFHCFLILTIPYLFSEGQY